jgi:AraC-like DNA-binding protein
MDSGKNSPLLTTSAAVTIRGPYDVNVLLRASAVATQKEAGPARHFSPVDINRHRSDPRGHAINVAIVRLAETRVSASAMHYGMAMSITSPTVPTVTLGLRRRGAVRIIGGGQDGAWAANTAVLYRERPGMRVETSDDHAGIALELPYGRVTAILESLVERSVGNDIDFHSSFPRDIGAGASIARLVDYIERELADPASLLEADALGASLQDTLIRALLLTQPHRFSALLERQAPAAAPFNVRRAEAYMRAHADEDISIEQLAKIAGCSVRSLQVAFRRWRDGTPSAALQRIRIERAHEDLRLCDGAETVGAIAARYGFSNRGRFARIYRARYGMSPLQTLRRVNDAEPLNR